MNDPRPRSSMIGFLILFAVLLFGVAVALDLGGLGARFGKLLAGPAAKTANALPAPAGAAAGIPPPKAVTPAWFIDAPGYKGAQEEQKITSAPMVLYFHKHACEACRAVEHELLGSSEMKKALAETEKVRVDVESGRREWELSVQYGVGDLPSLIAVAPGGTFRAIPVQRGGVLLAPARVAAQLAR